MSVDFQAWYSAYPKKVARLDAERAWKKLTPAQQQSAIEALPKHCAKWLSDGTDRNYIPHPATWLNGQRWEDEIEIEVKPTTNWRQSEQGTLEMARKVGITPGAGEDWNTLRGKIAARLVRVA